MADSTDRVTIKKFSAVGKACVFDRLARGIESVARDIHHNICPTPYAAIWDWGDDEVSNCAICRNNIMELCIECQNGQSVDQGGCSVSWGQCGHGFHSHCIKRWLSTRVVCPLGAFPHIARPHAHIWHTCGPPLTIPSLSRIPTPSPQITRSGSSRRRASNSRGVADEYRNHCVPPPLSPPHPPSSPSSPSLPLR